MPTFSSYVKSVHMRIPSEREETPLGFSEPRQLPNRPKRGVPEGARATGSAFLRALASAPYGSSILGLKRQKIPLRRIIPRIIPRMIPRIIPRIIEIFEEHAP
eukprot:1190652-Prorocentrum_minimum.AAC.1